MSSVSQFKVNLVCSFILSFSFFHSLFLFFFLSFFLFYFLSFFLFPFFLPLFPSFFLSFFLSSYDRAVKRSPTISRGRISWRRTIWLFWCKTWSIRILDSSFSTNLPLLSPGEDVQLGWQRRRENGSLYAKNMSLPRRINSVNDG